VAFISVLISFYFQVGSEFISVQHLFSGEWRSTATPNSLLLLWIMHAGKSFGLVLSALSGLFGKMGI